MGDLGVLQRIYQAILAQRAARQPMPQMLNGVNGAVVPNGTPGGVMHAPAVVVRG